jgi:hypothetical protein
MNKAHRWILVAILVVAAWFRLYRSDEFIPFWQEQVDDLLSIHVIWDNLIHGRWNALALHGQTGTYVWSLLDHNEQNPVYHGVAYYYILLPAAVLSGFNPYGVILFLIGLGVATIYLTYKVTSMIFQNERIGLIAAALGSVSFWLSAYSRWIWTPSMMPFFVTVSLLSLLYVLQGKKQWWYVLAVSTALGSQIHNSGYVPLVFFVGVVCLFRPSLPSRIWQKLLLLLLFIGPIVPTIWYEISARFQLATAMLSVPQHVPGIESMGSALFAVLRDMVALPMTPLDTFVGFKLWLRANSIFFGNTIIFLIGMCVVWVIGNVRRWHPFSQKAIWVIALWWVIFIPIPLLVEVLYIDQQINPYSRMNNGLIAFPFFLVCVSFGLYRLWTSRVWFGKVLVIATCAGYVWFNMIASSNFLWGYQENSWAYKELAQVAYMLTTTAGDTPYNVVIYRYSDGSFENPNVYESLYFTYIHGKHMPELFNNKSYWGVMRLPLSARPAGITLYVVDRAYLYRAPLPPGSQLVATTRSYHIYTLTNP